jgi:hypothetical protein
MLLLRSECEPVVVGDTGDNHFEEERSCYLTRVTSRVEPARSVKRL